MPDFAYVEVRNLVCPKCGQSLAHNDVIGFQWGYCYGRGGFAGYRINDPIKWRLDKSGRVPIWTYFKWGGANVGDPKYDNLVIRESERELRSCHRCGFEFAGIAVHIEGGRIASVQLHTSGLPAAEISIVNVCTSDLHDAEISIINPDGTLTPMPDWDDHPMQDVDETFFDYFAKGKYVTSS
jgi:ribosomal protein S27AE